MDDPQDRSDTKRQQAFDKGKDKRRQAILAACEKLIRETASTDFSMKELAVAAGISTYTTYNLIGSKSTVLYILLNQGIDKIALPIIPQGAATDPVRHVLDAGLAAANVFGSDPDYYRPLMRYLLGVLDPVHRPAYMERAYAYWRNVLQPLEDAKCFRAGFSRQAIARSLQVFFTGAIDYWIHGEMSGDEFRAQVRHGIAVHLLSLTRDEVADRLAEVIREAELALAKLLERHTLPSA